jgi:cyanate permease
MLLRARRYWLASHLLTTLPFPFFFCFRFVELCCHRRTSNSNSLLLLLFLNARDSVVFAASRENAGHFSDAHG